MSRPSLTIVVLALGAMALFALTFARGDTESAREVRTTLTLADALGTGDTAGYARALEPRPFVFPADHGGHPEFAIEWWYLTGNLETMDGHPFGYQLTFFRSALASTAPERASAWATRQAWMAHFALTDVRAERFHAAERFARGVPMLAGVDAAPFRVWLEDWSIEAVTDSAFTIRIRAQQDSAAIDFVIEQGKEIVMQGERGLSRKGPEPGNASFYYSMTRMPTTGTIISNGQRHDVTGTSWLDREWSTSALREGLEGWDWFALQFDDDTELMLYRLRTSAGASDAFSGGTFVNADGNSVTLGASDFEIVELSSWESPIDGARYPSEWSVRVQRIGLDLVVEPVLADQELDLAVRYWEGAVRVAGTRLDRTLNGRGYVELTGYAGPPALRVQNGAR